MSRPWIPFMVWSSPMPWAGSTAFRMAYLKAEPSTETTDVAKSWVWAKLCQKRASGLDSMQKPKNS